MEKFLNVLAAIIVTVVVAAFLTTLTVAVGEVYGTWWGYLIMPGVYLAFGAFMWAVTRLVNYM